MKAEGITVPQPSSHISSFRFRIVVNEQRNAQTSRGIAPVSIRGGWWSMFLSFFSVGNSVGNDDLHALDAAFIACLVSSDKQQRNASVSHLLSAIHAAKSRTDVDRELGRISSLLLRSDEWKAIPRHIDCFKFFVITPSVQTLLLQVFAYSLVYCSIPCLQRP